MTGSKRIGTFFLCVLLSAFLFVEAIHCRAEETQEAGSVTVADDAKVLMEEEADWLKGVAEALAQKSGWNVVVATCSDTGGKNAQTVCEEYFNQYTEGDNGISCLVDLDNQELYLATAGDAQQYLNDSRLDQILEDAHTAAEKEDYTQALYLMLYESDQNFSKGIPEDTNTTDGGFRTNRAAGGIVFLIAAAGGAFWLNRLVKRQSGGRQVNHRRRQYRRPPNVAAGSGRKPAGRSSVHTGAGGRKFGGRGKKF